MNWSTVQLMLAKTGDIICLKANRKCCFVSLNRMAALGCMQAVVTIRFIYGTSRPGLTWYVVGHRLVSVTVLLVGRLVQNIYILVSTDI